jgi:hypothetical protein
VPTKTRISLRMEQKAVVQYACDGDRFAFSVRDSFGMLTKDIILRYIEKCLHSQQQIDRKAGGAGLGLYLVANSASEYHVNVYPGVATEAICLFDLSAPKVQLKSFGVYHEKIDVAGRLAIAGAPKRVAGVPGLAGGDGLRAALVASVMLLMGAIGVVFWQAWQRPGKGSLAVTTEPPAATVMVNHARRGAAPLRVASLPVGATTVTIELPGYQTWERVVDVLPGKEPTRLEVALVRQRGAVVVESTPPGAHVWIDDQDTGKLTPATIDNLASGERHTVRVKQVGFRDATEVVTVPETGQTTTFRLPLALAPGYGSVHVESQPAGAAVLINGVEEPSSNEGIVLKAGSYDVTARLPGYIPYVAHVNISSGSRARVVAHMLTGGTLSLRSNVDARVFIDNHPVGRTPLGGVGLAEGPHTVTLRSQRPFLLYELKLAVKKGQSLERELKFGQVEVKAEGVVAKPAGAGAEGVTLVALPGGSQQLTLVNRSTGAERAEKVTVNPGETVVIEKW